MPVSIPVPFKMVLQIPPLVSLSGRCRRERQKVDDYYKYEAPIRFFLKKIGLRRVSRGATKFCSSEQGPLVTSKPDLEKKQTLPKTKEERRKNKFVLAVYCGLRSGAGPSVLGWRKRELRKIKES